MKHRRKRQSLLVACRCVLARMLLLLLLLSSLPDGATGQAAMTQNGDAPHPSLQGWDEKIRTLETKLEIDLKRVELDAAKEQQRRRKVILAEKATNRTKLNKDLGRVRSDVRHLVKAVEAAETELERIQAQTKVEQFELRQRNAKLTAEKILDQLHSGKLDVKVDYVSGQLVHPRATASLRVNSTTGLVTNSTAGTYTRKESDNVSASLEEEGKLTEELALENIMKAASAQTSILSSRDEALDEDNKVPVAAITDPELIATDDDFRYRVKEVIEHLRLGADPATFTIDFELLLDIVKLAMTAAFFGLVAVFLRLPPTAGFLVGGMLIGPSCLSLIGSIHEVQTLAQFGIIFLLFEQGLLYSQTYSGAAVLGSTLATGRMEDLPESLDAMTSPKSHDRVLSRRGSNLRKTQVSVVHLSQPSGSSDSAESHDPNVVGSIVLFLLVFSALAIVVLLEVVSSAQEAVVVACTVAICSTTIVSENLHAAHIANSSWGKGVLKMIAMHDLFMVPLLALPELLAFLSELGARGNDDDDAVEGDSTSLRTIAIQGGLIVGFLGLSTFVARRIIGAANLAQARMMGAKGELFTLSVVAYALLVASMSEKLKLSIEVGAILAGIILMKSPYVPKVLASIQSITSVFGGMYLTSLGMIISPSFVVQEASSIIQLVCLIGMFKLILVSTSLSRFFDYGITASLAVGSAMAQISETSLLVMAKAQRLGLVTRKTYLLLIPTTCIMLTLAPFSAAHLRRLKMQEVSGNDDGKIPHYLCLLRHLGILRQPRNLQCFSRSNDDIEEGLSYSHET